jgi:hypothetical protein
VPHRRDRKRLRPPPLVVQPKAKEGASSASSYNILPKPPPVPPPVPAHLPAPPPPPPRPPQSDRHARG